MEKLGRSTHMTTATGSCNSERAAEEKVVIAGLMEALWEYIEYLNFFSYSKDDDGPSHKILDPPRAQYTEARRVFPVILKPRQICDEAAAAFSPPPPALPEEMVWWEKSDGYAVGPRSKGMIAWVATIEEAQALCAAFRAAAAAMSEDAERYRFWRARYHGEFVLTIHSGGVVSLKFDGEIPSIPIAGPDYEPKVDAA